MTTLKLSELLSALSFALDLTEGQPAGHCIRASWIGVEIGRAMGLDAAAIRELYYTILLKDLGCSSNAARICQLYMTDDIGFKRDFKQLDDGLPQVLRFVVNHTGLGAGLAERFRAIVNIFQNGGEIARELIETRCERGSRIARRMRFSDAVADAIHALDEHWNGGGKPQRLSGMTIPLYARIALLAQVVEVFHRGAGAVAVIEEVSRRSGRWFDPAVVAVFETLSARSGFWADLASASEFRLDGDDCGESVDDDFLDDIAAAFGEIVDSKSPFTSGHCERVTVFADMIAERLGFSGHRRRRLKRAALLHDIGKLGVSNSILDKPGRLDEEEWKAMRAHAVHSETILSRIQAFAELAEIGGAHHERLDGKGYPKGLSAERIGLETRIVTTADIFDALTADRPYRAAMPVSKALEIMRADVGTAIDTACFAALEAALAALETGREPGPGTGLPLATAA